MSESSVKKYWWVVVIVVCALAFAAMIAMDTLAADRTIYVAPFAFAAIGAVFLWAYAIDKERQWWAVIPGISAFVIIATGLVDRFAIGTDSKNDWVDVLVIGAGASIIGYVLKRKDAKMVLYIVSAFAYGIGILMSPAALGLRLLLVVLDVIAAVYFVYRVNAGRPMMKTPGGWLHPQP